MRNDGFILSNQHMPCQPDYLRKMMFSEFKLLESERHLELTGKVLLPSFTTPRAAPLGQDLPRRQALLRSAVPHAALAGALPPQSLCGRRAMAVRTSGATERIVIRRVSIHSSEHSPKHQRGVQGRDVVFTARLCAATTRSTSAPFLSTTSKNCRFRTVRMVCSPLKPASLHAVRRLSEWTLQKRSF